MEKRLEIEEEISNNDIDFEKEMNDKKLLHIDIEIMEVKYKLELDKLKRIHLEKRYERDLELESLQLRELENKFALKKLELMKNFSSKSLDIRENNLGYKRVSKMKGHQRICEKVATCKENTEKEIISNINDAVSTGKNQALIVASMQPVPVKVVDDIRNKYIRCAKNYHVLHKCDRFKNDNVSERWSLVVKRGLCARCLRPGHRYSDCYRELECTICRKDSHCTLLHRPENALESYEDERRKAARSTHASGDGDRVQHSKSSVPIPCGMLGSGPTYNRVALPILPIKVGNIETYAMINSGSAASICSQSLANRMNSRGTPVEQILGAGNEDFECKEIIELEICEVEGETPKKLKDVYVTEKLRITTDRMLTLDGVKKWEHLRDLDLPLKPAVTKNVELVIGLGSSLCRHVLDQRHGGERDPSALKTMLGWVVLGPLTDD